MFERMKRVLPRRRYCVLFKNRLAYFSEEEVKLKNAGDAPGITVNEYNAVVGLAPGSAAAEKLQMEDVITEVDGQSVVGLPIDWRRRPGSANAAQKRKRLVKVMRLKGSVPLGRGVSVSEPCACVLNRINAEARAIEIDLSTGVLNAREDWSPERSKAKYIFICQNAEQARAWCEVLKDCCPKLPTRGGVMNLPTNLGSSSSRSIRDATSSKSSAGEVATGAAKERGVSLQLQQHRL